MSIWSALMGMSGHKWTFNQTWTLPTGNTNVQNMKVLRTTKTIDGIFGAFSCDYSMFRCVTTENLCLSIPAGRYRVVFDISPRLGYLTPHLMVAGRDAAAGGDAGIRIHKANEPRQLAGCIATGRVVDGDAVDWSDSAFNEMMLLTDKTKETWIDIVEAYGVAGA